MQCSSSMGVLPGNDNIAVDVVVTGQHAQVRAQHACRSGFSQGTLSNKRALEQHPTPSAPNHQLYHNPPYPSSDYIHHHRRPQPPSPSTQQPSSAPRRWPSAPRPAHPAPPSGRPCGGRPSAINFATPKSSAVPARDCRFSTHRSLQVRPVCCGHDSLTAHVFLSGAGALSIARDVFFYDLRDLSSEPGGLVLNPGITNANFYSMIEIVLVLSSHYFVQTDNGETLPRDSRPLHPGNYFIVVDGTVQVTDKIAVTRMKSLSTGTQTQVFRDQVHERDRRCVITKTENRGARFGIWDSFEAAHTFPLAYEQYWIDYNFGHWISLPPIQGGTINSVTSIGLASLKIRYTEHTARSLIRSLLILIT